LLRSINLLAIQTCPNRTLAIAPYPWQMYLVGAKTVFEVTVRLQLTDRFIARARTTKVQEDFFDETVTGLALRVTSKGVKAWTLMYTANGRRVRLTLGRYPAISLARARSLALEAQQGLAEGHDPRRGDSRMTVANLVETYITRHLVGLRSAGDVERRIRRNIIPVIGGIALADLHRRDATRVIDTVASRGAPVEAAHAFQDLRGMLRWAVARGDLDHNPIEGMRKPDAGQPRERVLSDEEIRTLWLALPAALPRHQRIIKLCLLTAQRIGEVAGMQRSELDGATWLIPGARTKNKHPHSVPLSPAALALIPVDLPFPVSPMACAAAIGRAQGKFGLAHWTAHDLRRTALTGMAKLGIPPIVLGHIANHRTTTKAGMTLSVYVQHAYEREKREALEQWAQLVGQIVATA
jgi:integrase